MGAASAESAGSFAPPNIKIASSSTRFNRRNFAAYPHLLGTGHRWIDHMMRFNGGQSVIPRARAKKGALMVDRLVRVE